MKLPQPKYTVTDVKHRYSIALPNGDVVGPLVSVTKVLSVLNKEALIGWAARESASYFKTELLRLGSRALTPETLGQIAKDAAGAHRRKAKDAADLGTKCHDIFEAIIQAKEPEAVPEELAEPARDFKRWRMQSDIELVGLELPVASLEHRFGGRLDAVGYSPTRGGFGIVDYKTSSGFYGNEYAYQVGGYACALAEQYGVEVAWAEIVRFGKKPPYDSEGRPVSDMTAAVRGFLTAAEMTRLNGVPIISKPTFSTAATRAAEAVAKVPAKKKRKSNCPF